MGLLTRLLDPPMAAVANPTDDFWYQPVGGPSAAGPSVSAESAMAISTVFRCVSAVADDVAAMPLVMYRRLDRGKERARNHPLYDVLHDQPNNWQTAFEWREMLMGHLLLRGNAYCLIEPGLRGFADQLIPLNPARMQVEQLDNRRLRYTYRNAQGRQEVYSDKEIFHLRGLSNDGIVGLSVVSLARESMGLALAAEKHGAQVFGQGAVPDGVLKLEGTLDKDAADRLKAQWHGAHTGRRSVGVLERGVTWQQVGMSHEDAQYLETRNFQIEEIARWFGVPLHRIGHTEKATSWGTGIEQFNLGYIQYTLLPWLRRWEQAILKDLILAPQTFFAEFLMDHLLRGDQQSRYAAYQSAINTGWMSPNEVRERENMNPAEGLDEFRVPQNMATVDESGQMRPANEPSPSRDQRAMLLAHEAAARVVRKEITAISRHQGREDFWEWLGAFYADHEQFVRDVLHLDENSAFDYAQSQMQAVLDGGPEVVGDWQVCIVPRLANLALGDIE